MPKIATPPKALAVKYAGAIPKTLRAYCDRNVEKIQEVSAGGGYSTDSGFAYDAFLRPGWRMCDDCVHTIIEPTVAAMISELRNLSPCDCDDCRTALEQQKVSGAAIATWS